MDRQIVYAGSIPLDTDLLSVQRNVQVGIGALARAILGPGPVVDGLQCVPSAAAYVVTMLPGSLTELAQNDYSAFGALPADSANVVRTALQPAASSVQLSPPADVNHVVCWLIQVQATEFDGTPIALPYWNASNPSVPYSGPGNSGSAQPTQRFLRVAISAKANGPQPWPIGTPPDADPGWIGLYAVTTVFNKPGIEAADIVPYYAAPRLRYTLPAMPPGVTQQAVFTTNNTWTAPDGVVWARVRVVGAGGGGGGGDTGYSGGGGGAGGYAEAVIGVTPRAVYGIEVGVGGGGGGPGAFGGAGTASTFNGLVTATGGEGGGSNNPDSHGGSPGSGSLGTLLQSGGYGGDGALGTLIPGGNGGASVFGGGGRGANGGGAPATGTSSGSGGGGAYGVSATGGAGATGVVIVEF